MQGCGANPKLHQNREPHAYPDPRPAHSPYEKPHHSPIATAYAHQSPLQRPLSQHQHAGGMEAMSHSPVSPSVYSSMHRGAVQPPPANYARRPSMKDEVRRLLSPFTHSLLTTHRHLHLHQHVLTPCPSPASCQQAPTMILHQNPNHSHPSRPTTIHTPNRRIHTSSSRSRWLRPRRPIWRHTTMASYTKHRMSHCRPSQ